VEAEALGEMSIEAFKDKLKEKNIIDLKKFTKEKTDDAWAANK